MREQFSGRSIIIDYCHYISGAAADDAEKKKNVSDNSRYSRNLIMCGFYIFFLKSFAGRQHLTIGECVFATFCSVLSNIYEFSGALGAFCFDPGMTFTQSSFRQKLSLDLFVQLYVAMLLTIEFHSLPLVRSPWNYMNVKTIVVLIPCLPSLCQFWIPSMFLGVQITSGWSKTHAYACCVVPCVNCQMEQYLIQLLLGFEIVTGT